MMRRKGCGKRLSFDGLSLTLDEWAARLGITRQALQSRLAYGWPLADALTAKVGERSNSYRVRTYQHVGEALSVRGWAARSGVKLGTLRARLARGMPVAEAIQPGPVMGRGMGSDFLPSKGTGGGSTAQESAEIEISAESIPTP